MPYLCIFEGSRECSIDYISPKPNLIFVFRWISILCLWLVLGWLIVGFILIDEANSKVFYRFLFVPSHLSWILFFWEQSWHPLPILTFKRHYKVVEATITQNDFPLILIKAISSFRMAAYLCLCFVEMPEEEKGLN